MFLPNSALETHSVWLKKSLVWRYIGSMVQTLLLHSSPIVHRIPSNMAFSSPKTMLFFYLKGFSEKQIKKMAKKLSQHIFLYPDLMQISFWCLKMLQFPQYWSNFHFLFKKYLIDLTLTWNSLKSGLFKKTSLISHFSTTRNQALRTWF